jgi:general nucleoside transport system ATP-binding protein
MTMPVPDFEFKQISKRFGSVFANQDVSFRVEANSIHGVVGENGAGKSTIMKTLYGLHHPDSGEIWVRGKAVRISNPQKAIRLGIGMVHQHFMLVPSLTVWENIILGAEPSKIIHRRAVLKALEALKGRFGFAVDLCSRIDSLGVGQQQQVEILKVLYRQADILILDEPTAVLSPQEVASLFQQLTELWRSGKTIVLITHKLKEILSFTERVTVMRRGRVVGTFPTNQLTERALAEKIIGSYPQPLQKPEVKLGEPVLQVENLTLTHRGRTSLDDVSFTIRAGEIVGIAGVDGNGQQELVEVLSRIAKPTSGRIIFDGTSLLDDSAKSAKARGLSLIPPDRLREGLVTSFSVRENFLLGRHRNPKLTRGPFFRNSVIEEHTRELIEEYDVRPANADTAAGALSGGNQQKIIIARETESTPRLLIAAYPTRGVDIGATEFIHRLFLSLCRRGTAILLISSELDEIRDLADRIVVICHGRVMGEAPRTEATESRLGLWMTGATA